MQCSNAGSVRSCSPRPRHRTSFRVSWTPSFPFPLKLSSFLSLLITTRLGSSSSPRSQASLALRQPKNGFASQRLCVPTVGHPWKRKYPRTTTGLLTRCAPRADRSGGANTSLHTRAPFTDRGDAAVDLGVAVTVATPRRLWIFSCRFASHGARLPA